MLPNGFYTEGLFTMPKVENGNDLNKFCKLEGMNYLQLVSEVHGMKSLLDKGRNMKLFSGSHSRAR